MNAYQDLLFCSNPPPYADNQDDLLLSSLTNDSHIMFKSADSMRSVPRKRINQAIASPAIKEELQEEMTQKKLNTDDVHLLKLTQQLKQQLIKQQQEFYAKELEFQQKLLHSQRQHEQMIELQKTKYEMVIDELESKLEQKNQEIIHLTGLFQQLQLEAQSQNRPTTKKIQVTDECADSNGFFTQRLSNPLRSHKPSHSHSNTSDERLLHLYRQEIDKIKQQTLEFEMQFESQKRSIKQEISLLKSQKMVLQKLICQKKQPALSEKQSAVGSEHKSGRTKRESQSIQAYGHKSKKSFEF